MISSLKFRLSAVVAGAAHAVTVDIDVVVFKGPADEFAYIIFDGFQNISHFLFSFLWFCKSEWWD
jgi:hypothetical protein